jgi:Leucine-rich repeat (LRR) protein
LIQEVFKHYTMGIVVFILLCVGFYNVVFGQYQFPNQYNSQQNNPSQNQPTIQITFQKLCESVGYGRITTYCLEYQVCSNNIQASQKEIRFIGDQTLTECTVLQRLDLQDNIISEITQNAFRAQPNLQQLLLKGNQLKILNPTIFNPLTSLTELWLQNNLIEIIENALFSKNKNLQILYLNENKILAVGPNTFSHLTYLKEMTLYGNPCMFVNLAFNTNHHKAGIFFSAKFGYRKWDNNNMCVSTYDIIKNPQKYINKIEECQINFKGNFTELEKKNKEASEKNVENQNLRNQLATADVNYKILSQTSENYKSDLSQIRISNQKYQNDLSKAQEQIAENERIRENLDKELSGTEQEMQISISRALHGSPMGDPFKNGKPMRHWVYCKILSDKMHIGSLFLHLFQ